MTEPGVSERDYDFRVERIANMSESDVDHELSQIYSGASSHPYINARDGRHNAANAFALALHERKLGLQAAHPPEDEGALYVERQKTQRRHEAEQLQRHLDELGFQPFSLPDEIEPHHIDVMRRDALIQEGRLGEAFTELTKEADKLGLTREPALSQLFSVLRLGAEQSWDRDPVTKTTPLDRNPALKQLATDAAFAIHKLVAQRIGERHRTMKASVDAAVARERQAAVDADALLDQINGQTRGSR